MRRGTETTERPKEIDAPADGNARDQDQREEEWAAEQEYRRRESRPRRGRVALLVALAIAIALFLAWRAVRPVPVDVVRPVWRTVTETVAASGQVGGRRETVVGAQAQGVVEELWVDEGDVVVRGQRIARIQNDVAQAQVRQAEQALQTARAQLAQAAAGPRASELNAARAQVRQAEAQVRQAQAQLEQARAAVAQAEARRDLAQRNLERYRYLLSEGAIARQAVDQAESEYRTAAAAVTSAEEGVDTVRANLAAAQAAVAEARARLRTVEEGPRPEAVEVARRRVQEAEAALRVAREQAQDYIVRALFPGTVTAILAEPGATVGLSSGVVRLVQTGRPEIRVDVDESNLADLKVGQQAIITSSTFRNVRLEGRVARIGAQVDPTRGTIEVIVIPDQEPAWLRPGQTVNVNIITAPAAKRLVIPRTALRGFGDQRVVLVVRDGRAQPQPVLIGPVSGEWVPVLEGLSPDDRVIRNGEPVEPGARVEVRNVTV